MSSYKYVDNPEDLRRLKSLKKEEEIQDYREYMPHGFAVIWRQLFESPRYYLRKIDYKYYSEKRRNLIREAKAELELPSRLDWYDWARYPMYREQKRLNDLLDRGWTYEEVCAEKRRIRSEEADDPYWDYDEFVKKFNKFHEGIKRYKALREKEEEEIKKYGHVTKETDDAIMAEIQYGILDEIGMRMERDPDWKERRFRELAFF